MLLINEFDSIDKLFFTLVVILVTTNITYNIMTKFGRPIVLGGIIAGIIIQRLNLPTKYFDIHAIAGLGQMGIVMFMMLVGNQLNYKKENGFLDAVKSVAKEPMVLLLLVASIIYFISGKTGDGIFLSSAIIRVSAISLYQDSRSRNALEKLKNFTQAKCKVIRNNETIEINSEELVIGDYLIVEE